MEVTIAQATTFIQYAGVADFRSLGPLNLALDYWISRKKTVFAQEDLWFGTLLVDLNQSLNNTRNGS